ncbi:MAG: GGDEF domain-containing protein, partial [Bradyrhizobium sp.]
MGTSASPFLNPIAAELESVGAQPTAQVLSRRLRQRRQIQLMIAASYLLDAIILWVYARAGTIPVSISSAYAACGLLAVAVYLLLSEAGFTERFKDHYFVAPQLATGMAMMLVFAYLVPEVGVMFLCTLF